MESANIVIIGAGIVGLSVAAEISKNNDSVYVFEKNKMMGMETSNHNSGVIHSGIYYPKGTLKSLLSIKGNSMIYEICKKYSIPYKQLGKLIVGSGEDEIEQLQKLMRNGNDNGIAGLKMLDSDGIKRLEPAVSAERAIYVPSTGIVEPDDLMNRFYADITRNGAVVAMNTEVTGIKQVNGGYILEGISSGERFSIKCNTVINCAGLYSDKIAEMAGLDIDKLGYRLSYIKGDYFRLSGNPPVKMLVYPVPYGHGLGIHITPDLSGSVKLGPNAYHVENIDYRVESSSSDFIESVKRFLPSISDHNVYEDSAGIRPQLKIDNGSFKDFIIRNEVKNGMPGLINLIGIESPGLTASPAIGEYVSQIYQNEVKG
ncbi:NAD(P)/FAD-dependent oxidoreductase [Ferroplasma sp.]|uniref:NAD(P)/FAD-dependent oxidoreductase n=1 Tax=Ferroplasma sp. TaxID=2591003 RepID=UPI0026297806|nr:NAD(P)/FAD-dependent oxidoreductase [Ferroplasma sp.]